MVESVRLEALAVVGSAKVDRVAPPTESACVLVHIWSLSLN